jgi:CheY-like chemotaxis protein
VELDEARTGAEAVRRVRDGGAAGAYDLIITDGKMPVMDGREVRHAICVSARAS